MAPYGSESPSPGPPPCKECVKKRGQGHKNAQMPKYCQRHQCVFMEESGALCTKRKKSAEPRCTTHATCTFSNCDNSRLFDKTGIPSDYCSRHTCAISSCREGKVHNPLLDHHDDLCATHLSKVCARSGCYRVGMNHGYFCSSHTCQIELCREKIVGDQRPFCTEHNRCSMPECTKERSQIGQRFESVCSDHYISDCRHTACSNKASKPSEFCNLHSCQQKGCKADSRPSRGKPYCTAHRCSDNGCYFPRAFSERDGALNQNSYCVKHECENEQCSNHTSPGKPFCTSHCCTKGDCQAKRDGHNRFPTLCYTHHEEEIKIKTREEFTEEINKKRRAEAAEKQRLADERLADEKLAAHLAEEEAPPRRSKEYTHRPAAERRYPSPGPSPATFAAEQQRPRTPREYSYHRRQDSPPPPTGPSYGRYTDYKAGDRAYPPDGFTTPEREFPRSQEPEPPRAGQARTRTFDEYAGGRRASDEYKERQRERPKPAGRWFGLSTPEPDEGRRWRS